MSLLRLHARASFDMHIYVLQVNVDTLILLSDPSSDKGYRGNMFISIFILFYAALQQQQQQANSHLDRTRECDGKATSHNRINKDVLKEMNACLSALRLVQSELCSTKVHRRALKETLTRL